jgi:hypothetical protein
MCKFILIPVLCFFSALTLQAQPDSINQRIFLIGDAGDMYTTTHPVIDWLKKNVDWNDEKNAVIYLGDNVYPEGLPMEGAPDYPHSKAILDDQISIVKGKKSRAIFIPGNHDWRNGKMGGWEQSMNQTDYINSQEQKNVQAWPLNGCPGPIQVELSDKVVVVLIDSQWFLFLHDKPGPGSNCDAKTIDEFSVELNEIVASHPNQLVVVATHHALYSYGPHGGDYGFKEHIFPFTALSPNLYIPLPIIGSIYPITRGVFGSVQDIPHPLYKTMINTIEAVIKKHPYAVSVAGHDHGLQFNFKDSIPYIVSGSGSVLTRIKPGRFNEFSDANLGFTVIEVWKSGKTEVKFYNLQSADMSAPTFTRALKTIQPPATRAAEVDTTRVILDSVIVVAANPKLKGNGFKKFMIGDNYREEWAQPIRVGVLDMGKELGGLKPLKQGGGKQTKSLRVEDAKKKEWALRSVDKNPEAAIPPDLRQTFVRDIVRDGISASYPYGALSMGVLSEAANVPYLKNRIVYVPDDPRLDRFRSSFKNTLALMEEREPAGVTKTWDTDEIVLKMAKDNDDHVDQKLVLRARLLDNFVMDLDRHEGQWLWAAGDTGKGKIYYPIPKDRDQVFYTNQGILPWFAQKPWLVPELQGFRAHAKNIRTFNRAARNFDRTFLTELSADEWKHAVDTFLTTMTDPVIEKALHQQPEEIRKYEAEKIIQTLKERRKYFADEMMEYYRFLARVVTIVGTNQREQITITKNSNGFVHVVMNKIAKDSTVSSKIYDRVFDPEVTKELRIFGLNEDDRFIVEGPNSPIKIRIIGGSGNDEFINNGTGKKVRVHDVSFENNKFSGTESFKKRVHPDPQENRYDRLNFKYSYIHPSISLEYNIDDGLFIGPRFEYVRQGFRREPYGTRQFISATKALNLGSVHVYYEGEVIKFIRNNDLLLKGDFRAPVNVTNFFGLGNNTVFDKNSPGGIQYYRTRYNIINATAYLSRRLQSWMRFNYGPTFQYYRLDSAKNAGKYITSQSVSGVEHAGIYNPRHYLGVDVRVDINSLNNKVNPTRGLALNAGIRPLFGLDQDHNQVIQANVDMRIFMNLFAFPRFVLATRFGWGRNYGDFEFPQAMYLGGTDNLRGFRKERFAGRGMLFNNTEIRVKLADFNTYLFPGSLGIFVFNDIGRVRSDGQESHTWHDGYGGGVWIAPINRFVFSVSLAHSSEESILPRATFGFQF